MTYRDGSGFRLGQWVGVQRRGYQQGTLEEERARRLEALSGWTWNPNDDAWDENLARLRNYVQREGNAQVPRRFSDGDGFALGQWAAVQRRKYRQGTLEKERHSRLEALPGWTWTQARTTGKGSRPEPGN